MTIEWNFIRHSARFWNSTVLIAWLVSTTCAGGASLFAGQFNTVLDVGVAAPAWGDLPATDGREYALSSFGNSDVIVIAFTCNSCPYAVDMEDRLNDFVKRYDGKPVTLVAVNVNNVDEDRMPAMKQRAGEKGFKFPYLWDQSQAIAKAYGAKYTPEFFVLNKDRKVVYMGSYDDSPAGDQVTKTYVIDAVESLLAGRPVVTAETIPIGCRIRMEREPRKRTP